MSFQVTIYESDIEFPIELEEMQGFMSIRLAFAKYDWEKARSKSLLFHAPAYVIQNKDNGVTLVINTDGQSQTFRVKYSMLVRELNSSQMKVHYVYLKESFSKEDVSRIIGEFVSDPRLLRNYKADSSQRPKLSKNETKIGWLAYGLLLTFLVFIDFKLFQQFGIATAPLVVLGIIGLIFFVMIRYRPKRTSRG